VRPRQAEVSPDLVQAAAAPSGRRDRLLGQGPGALRLTATEMRVGEAGKIRRLERDIDPMLPNEGERPFEHRRGLVTPQRRALPPRA